MKQDDELRLREIFAETFGIAPEDVQDTSSPESIVEWKSLNHLALMTAVEEAFDITFSMEEMAGANSFGALRRAVSSHVCGRSPQN